MRFTKLEDKEAKDVADEIRELEDAIPRQWRRWQKTGSATQRPMKHFFNVLIWVILMVIPVIVLLLTNFIAGVVVKFYWPYRAWVERTFPTR